MRTKWVVLVVIMVALGVALTTGPHLWTWATTVQRWSLLPPMRGDCYAGSCFHDQTALRVQKIRRWSRAPIRTEAWSAETGSRCSLDTGPQITELISPYMPMSPSPIDQATPTAPWIAKGITAAEFWEQVKEPGWPTLEEFMAEQEER